MSRGLALGHRELLALRSAGLLDDADEVARRYDMLATAGVPVGVIVGYLRGQVLLARGQAGAAAPALQAAVDGLIGREPNFLFWARLALVTALAVSGNPADARAALAAAEASYGPALELHATDLRLARAWSTAADDGMSEAIALAREGAAIAHERGQWAVEVVALQTAVQFGDPTAADRLAELCGRVEGPRAPAAAEHAAALAATDGAALHAASERWEEMGAWSLAADAAAQAAVVHDRFGLRGSSLSAAARATTLAARCGGVRTPALRAATWPLPLTKREREIATLAAGGLSNRAIAQRLMISVRTVEGHVLRACAKLGVERRSALTDIIGHAE